MAGRQNPSFLKRQKEQKRKEKAEAKRAARQARRADKDAADPALATPEEVLELLGTTEPRPERDGGDAV